MNRVVFLCLLIGCGRSMPTTPSSVERVRTIARERAVDLHPALDLVSARVEDHFSVRLARVNAVSYEIFSMRWKWRAAFYLP